MVPYVPRPQRGSSVRAGLFRKDEFEYDPESDTVLCPGSQRLQPYSSSVLRGLKKINYANRRACHDCPIRSHARRIAFVPCPAWRTRPCSTACRPDWRSVRRYSSNAARWWSIHSAHQTMDEPRGVPDAWPGEGSRRVQLDRARLQSQAGAQYSRLY